MYEQLFSGWWNEGKRSKAATAWKLLWGAAEVLRETIGIPWSSFERMVRERFVSATHQLLGEQVFATAWAEGRTMTPEQALAARELSRVTPAITPVTPASTYPAGLSAREVEVLRLVAQGMTDAQVADKLVLSPRTVQGHLRSIYNKINVNSRSAATRYAVEHKLV